MVDSDQIVKATFLQRAVWLESAGSTNDHARSIAGSVIDQLPCLVGADVQTAGRGRGNNRWWSDNGSLTFSLLVDSATANPVSLVPLAAAVAICDAIDAVCPGLQPRAKWPNDVFVDGRKVAGVLTERMAAGDHSLLIVGVGINVDVNFESAADELDRRAVSLSKLFGAAVQKQQLLVEFLDRIESGLVVLKEDSGEFVARFLARSLFDRSDMIEFCTDDGQMVTGRWAGIGDEGQLLLRVGKEVRKFYSGHAVSSRKTG